MTRPVGTSVAEKLIGRTLDGKYRIDGFVGRGAMGLVFRATQVDVEKTVALKIMRSDVMADETALQRFYREARATSRLSHPNTIKVLESGQFSEGYPYIAMEFLDGEPLTRILADEGPQPAQRIVKIVVQVAKALAEAHKENIVHRDLKPGNIMVMQLYGEHDFVKVLDFGIAKILTDTTSQQLTQAGFALGTPHYMSPEQAKGRPLDARSDLYSLGVIMYEMLTGRVPFRGDSSVDVIMQHISAPVPRVQVDAVRYPYTAKVAAVIERLLEKDRDKRVQSSLELIRVLEPLNLEGERMTLDGRVERVAQAVLGGETPAPEPASDVDEASPVKTMALNADDLADLGLAPPTSRAAEPSPSPRTVTAPKFDAAPVQSLAESGLAEKTMAMSAAAVLSLAGALPEGPVDAEATQLFDAISAELPAAPTRPGAAEPPAPPPDADDDVVERTALFDQLDVSLLAPVPSAAAGSTSRPAASPSPLPSSISARRMTAPVVEVTHEDSTMMFDVQQQADQAVSQDGSTMMFDPSDYLRFQTKAPTADQESSTVMLDAASLGLGGPAINQDGSTMMVDAASAREMLARATGGGPSSPGARGVVAAREEGTLMLDGGGAAPAGRAVSTSPGIRTSPGTTTSSGAAQGGLSTWLVWTLIGVGSLAIAVALYFILLG